MRARPVALIIHAGAGSYPKDKNRLKIIQTKLKGICEKGYQYLKKHSAVDTVTEVVRQLEDWPETNAGTGAVLQSDGVARLSASLMDGHTTRFSGVINLEKIKNPILIAKLLQNEKDRILSNGGALKFAKEKGFRPSNPRTEQKKIGTGPKYGTVGACALDRNGRLAAATSTGGCGMEHIGRVSDSATPAGNYANDYAACSATGTGEDIIDESLCSRLVMLAMERDNLEGSFNEVFKAVKNRKFGAIGIDRAGKTSWRTTTEILYYSLLTPYNSEIF